MENASKALLIAGGILLVMLIIGLLFFSWSKFSEFYSKNDELAEIEDLSKFNLQFTNYQRKKVYGYELISLANKVADYNMRYSTEGKNDEKYNKIQMNINLSNNQKQFSKDDNLYLFKSNTFTIDSITNIIDKAELVEKNYGNSNAASKIAKSIDSIILSDTQLEYNRNTRNMTETQSMINAIETFNRLTDGEKIDNYKNVSDAQVRNAYNNMVNNLKNNNSNILAYYEYYQFKRGIFECGESDITYDNVTGRVSSISFTFTGKIE